jgi:hypothetical protein
LEEISNGTRASPDLTVLRKATPQVVYEYAQQVLRRKEKARTEGFLADANSSCTMSIIKKIMLEIMWHGGHKGKVV